MRLICLFLARQCFRVGAVLIEYAAKDVEPDRASR